jgi:hypothetical protein
MLAILAVEGQKSALELAYNELAYAALVAGGEVGLNSFVLLMNAYFSGIGWHDEEVDWGIANITLSVANALEDAIVDGMDLLPEAGSALDTVNILRTTSGNIRYLAAALKYFNSFVNSGVTGEERIHHQMLIFNVGVSIYRDDWANGNYAPRRGPDGIYRGVGDVGDSGAHFLNTTVPLIDQARVTLAWCTQNAEC